MKRDACALNPCYQSMSCFLPTILSQPGCLWDQTPSLTVSSFCYVTLCFPPTYCYSLDEKWPDEISRCLSGNLCEGYTAVWSLASLSRLQTWIPQPLFPSKLLNWWFLRLQKTAHGSWVKHSELLETSNTSKSFLHEKCFKHVPFQRNLNHRTTGLKPQQQQVAQISSLSATSVQEQDQRNIWNCSFSNIPKEAGP